jgi:hypothetical protein
MLDWLIVGGGIHGTYLSHFLLTRMGLDRSRLRVLDPYDTPLHLWTTFANNTGMEFLRSGQAHHLHYDPFSLRTFALTREGAALATFVEPYSRPSFALFQAHSQRIIERHRLDELRIVGRAAGLKCIEDGWRVETPQGGLEARNLVLAIGATEQPYWPEWAVPLRNTTSPIHHIFDPNLRRESLPVWSHTVVIGGGITAVQTALAMVAQHGGNITLLMRHPLRVYHFDADPCWVSPACLDSFHHDCDSTKRRRIIQEARNRGSLPQDVAHTLQVAATQGLLTRRIGEVNYAKPIADGTIYLKLKGGETIASDRIILATGFDPARPGGSWLDDAVSEHNLPIADCGYPMVDKSLCWKRGLYVMGPLAELEIGPVSRNIIGAKLASERIATTLS